jgi:hypothetical protein
MNIRAVLLSACISGFALGAASLPAKAEDGRNGAAAVGAIAGFAAGAAMGQGEGYGLAGPIMVVPAIATTAIGVAAMEMAGGVGGLGVPIIRAAVDPSDCR